MSDLTITTDTHTPDRLFAGNFPVITKSITVISGENVTRGAVLGMITSGGKYNLSLSAAVDGSEVPAAILAEDVDASGGDKVAICYVTGEFNDAAVTLGASHTLASIGAGLADLGIHLKTAVPFDKS